MAEKMENPFLGTEKLVHAARKALRRTAALCAFSFFDNVRHLLSIQ